jgi:histidyl-tRNA synthetase
MAQLAPPPGTADLTPAEMSAWRVLATAAQDIFARYGFGEMQTPVFEFTEIFARGLGDETEVVRKEMYTFTDRGGRSLTLRPEGTAGIMRALLATDVLNGVEQRVYYLGPMFRGERPAAGRRRQFHQVGVENAGRMAPELDAECVAMLLHYLEACGIAGSRLVLNTRGDADDRAPAAEFLRDFFAPRIAGMCPDCNERLARNPWRILDCKVPACREVIAGAPDIATCFRPESRAYFAKVCRLLDDLGIPYQVDPRLVRGLDYYVHTVFEVLHDGLGAQNAIAGGGRYEVHLPGAARAIPGVGFAAGLERLIMAREAEGAPVPPVPAPAVFLAGLGEAAIHDNLILAMQMRRSGIAAIAEVEARSLKAQLRAAAKSGARFAVIRGDSELAAGTVILRDLADAAQQEMPLGKVVDALGERLRAS